MTDVRKSRRTRLPKASSMLLTDQRRRKDGTQIWKLAYPSVFDPDHSKRPGSICVPGTNDLQHTRRESPKELSRPLARERDITSRSESRCRRQLYKAGGAFSLSRRLLLASAASNPTTVLSARVFSARVTPTASHCASCLFSSRLGSRFDSRSNPSEIARALPGPAPPLSRFSRHGEGKDYTLAFGVGVVTRAVLCMTKYRTFGSSWFRLKPKRDPPFPLRDLLGSRRQVRADTRRSLTLVRDLLPNPHSCSGYNHQRRLPIDVDAGTRTDCARSTKPRAKDPVQYAETQTHTCAHDRRADYLIAR